MVGAVGLDCGQRLQASRVLGFVRACIDQAAAHLDRVVLPFDPRLIDAPDGDVVQAPLPGDELHVKAAAFLGELVARNLLLAERLRTR